MPDRLQKEIEATVDLVNALALLERLAAPVAILTVISGSVVGKLWVVDGTHIRFGRLSSSSTGGAEDILTLLLLRSGKFDVEISRDKAPVCDVEVKLSELFTDRQTALDKLRQAAFAGEADLKADGTTNSGKELRDRLFQVLADKEEQGRKRAERKLKSETPAIQIEEAEAEPEVGEAGYVTKPYFKSAFAKKAAEFGHNKLMEGRLPVEQESDDLQLVDPDAIEATHEMATVAQPPRRKLVQYVMSKKVAFSLGVVVPLGCVVLFLIVRGVGTTTQATSILKPEAQVESKTTSAHNNPDKVVTGSADQRLRAVHAARPAKADMKSVARADEPQRTVLTQAEKDDAVQELARGEDLVKSGKVDEAIEVYTALVRKYPRDVRFRLILAHTYLAAERYNDTRALCQEGMNYATAGPEFEIFNSLLKEIP